jgi:hypothetical protein
MGRELWSSLGRPSPNRAQPWPLTQMDRDGAAMWEPENPGPRGLADRKLPPHAMHTTERREWPRLTTRASWGGKSRASHRPPRIVIGAAVRATRRRNRLSAISFPAGCSRRCTAGRHPAGRGRSPVATMQPAACAPARQSWSCGWRRGHRLSAPDTIGPGRCPSGTSRSAKQLDHATAHPGIAGPGQALLPSPRAAFIRRGRSARHNAPRLCGCAGYGRRRPRPSTAFAVQRHYDSEPYRVSRRQVCLSPTRPLGRAQAGHSRRLPPRRAGCFRSARAGACG